MSDAGIEPAPLICQSDIDPRGPSNEIIKVLTLSIDFRLRSFYNSLYAINEIELLLKNKILATEGGCYFGQF